MEALLATIAMIGAIVVGLYLLSRAWPKQRDAPGVGGYRAGLHGQRDQGSDPVSAPLVQEEDDVRWGWTQPPTDGGADGSTKG